MKIIIVGAGEVGFHIASHLARENKEVVMIDQDAEAIRRVSDHLDVQTLIGPGNSPVILEDAGIRDAEILLAVTNSDETNLVACLMADVLSPVTKKLARLRSADYDRYHEVFSENAPHIDTVINPEIEVVKTIERMMSVPGAVDVGDFAGGRVKSVSIRLDETTPLAGTRLMDLPGWFKGPRPLIFSIMRDEETIIPTGKDRLLPGDLIYFIVEQGNLIDTLKQFNKHADPIRRVLIVGGGRIGSRLAQRLESLPVQVKIIEKNPKKCDRLAEQLNKPVVLCGDGSDQDLLREENVQDTDVVITLTGDEETNILSSLLAKRLGAKKTITQISKFSYFPLMLTIGIEQVVDPRLSAINTILQHIRRGKVLSAMSIKGEEAEVLEAIALETSDIVGKPLKNISFPKGMLVTTILRGEEVIIPSGESIVEPGDRIIIFGRREAIPKIEKILAVKLEYF
ncbi:Trk system potassium transporter TrkA [Desulfonema ishimotonii]|uniref:Trk system potassium uptake protein TrkA n=1 Tax=Desulfonema ishimotonii TaxID=45657 RepID=A0A401FYX5_9BACT|nr:Trk system potassium transporter TrkA [Desulfonema ishimotonii]GBC62171.1 Trk system potassium transporter TrkA [Desulfonema ishimotonii]